MIYKPMLQGKLEDCEKGKVNADRAQTSQLYQTVGICSEDSHLTILCNCREIKSELYFLNRRLESPNQLSSQFKGKCLHSND